MEIKQSVKKIYSKEYWLLVCVGFFPLMWKILEIAFLSSFPNALKILGQIALINIIFKIFEESLINPLYKTLSKQNISAEDEKQTIINKFLLCYFIVTAIFTAVLFILSEKILSISKIPGYIFNETVEFLKIYIIASGFGIIAKYLYVCSLINKDNKKILIYFLIKSLLTTILFVLLVPEYTFGLGVKGVAVAELIINIATILFLINMRLKPSKKKVCVNLKEYAKLSCFAFAETLIRNVVYYFVILVFLNVINNQDLYFVSNEFIWSIMLVPTLSQSALIKQELANDKQSSLKPYFVNSVILISFMVLMIPIALVLFRYVYNFTNYLDYFFVLIKLLPCYVVFIFDSVVEAYFISTGKMHHILIQTIITNIVVYLTALVLYLCGVWVITLDSIIILFNLGVILSSAYTITAYLIENNRNKIDFKKLS